MLLANHMLNTFKCSFITISLLERALPQTAWKFMKMINQRKLSIESFSYYINAESTEFIPRILDECTEVTDYIVVKATFPDDFLYTPPRPFKAKYLSAWETSNWLNLESSLNCRDVSVDLDKISNRTTETYSLFFSKWMDSDTPLQKLTFYSIEEPEYRKIMDALSNQGTKRIIDEHWIEVTRRNESKLFINTLHKLIFIYTEQAYLEKLKWDEEQELAEKLSTSLQVQECQ
uniref:FBA_2 domain-containing protein n=1 Tax=Caenorhabditis tropicalis TaxID=1561998 RepID=A0A1I7UTI7_9PELO